MTQARVVITGSSGSIGSLLVAGLRGVEVVPFDLPERDARVAGHLDLALPGASCVVHLAWDTEVENWASGRLAPGNALMLHTVLARALHHGVRRVVLASSVHVDMPPGRDPAYVSRPGTLGTPDSPYGANKVFAEALGAFYATQGLEVVSIRFGGVTAVHPVDDPVEGPIWISHADCVRLVQACVDAETVPGRYVCVNGMSDNRGGWHDLANPFGWVPRDGDRNRTQP
jgi:nucleoside-diphosphate-sugar epimerase